MNLGLDAEPLVPLLGDGQLDTLALGQRDERLVALKDKTIREKKGMCASKSINMSSVSPCQ